MKAEDLRIGNTVLRNGHIIDISVEGLKEFYYIGDTHANSKSDKREYLPIPLTPEILEKCGFVFNKFTYDFGKLSICLPGTQYRDGRVYFNSWCIIDGEITPLHRLQNIYYDLTDGQELTFKR